MSSSNHLPIYSLPTYNCSNEKSLKISSTINNPNINRRKRIKNIDNSIILDYNRLELDETNKKVKLNNDKIIKYVDTPENVLSSIRKNVKLALFKLFNSNSQINPLALSIENELFKKFVINFDTTEYKIKARDIIFNLKDVKNIELFNNVKSGKVSPSELVLMSSDELANSELKEIRKIQQEENISKAELYIPLTVTTEYFCPKCKFNEAEITNSSSAQIEVSFNYINLAFI